MYESYWQMTQKPFENTADPRFYYPGESHQAALLKLRYAIENRRGGALLAGPAGCGKTLVVNILRKMLNESFSPWVHLVFPQMSTAELLSYMADEMDGSRHEPAGRGVQESVRQIERFLTENTARGRHAVVIVDEAHLVENVRTLEALRLLLNFESGGQAGMTLLLCGQTAMLPTLDRMPQLEERLAVKCLLRPFTERETAEYVAHRLKVSGAARPLFDPDSLPTLHELTHGIARRINRLCDLALLIGFAEERQSLSAAHFESVCEELVTVVPEQRGQAMTGATLREGIFSLNTRRFGTVAELLVMRLARLGKGRNLFHDLYDDIENKRAEVKFSRVLKKHERRITEETVLRCIEEATGEQRMAAFASWQSTSFDCNIQQIKKAEFEVLYYGLFFSDKVLVFRIDSQAIGPQILYSDKQHKGNVGEGQFHVSDKTLQIHLDNYRYGSLNYDELLALLS